MGRNHRYIAMALGALLCAASAGAAGWKEVNAAEVKALMDAGGATVVNPLSRIEFNDLHIAGSVNIAPHELEAKLPSDKGAALVFYCLGMK